MTSKTLECPLCCNEVFTSHSSLKYHLLSMIENLTCPACSKRFEKILDLAEHLGRECNDDEDGNSNEDVDINTVLIKTEDTSGENENFNNSILAQALMKRDNAAEIIETDNSKKNSVNKNAESSEQLHEQIENAEEYFYCSSCAVSFVSIDKHLQQCHEGQEVYIEVNIYFHCIYYIAYSIVFLVAI